MSYTKYSFSTKKPSPLVHSAVIISYALGVLLYATSTVEGIPYPIIFQTATILLLAVGTYLLFRFVFKKFTYEISENSERTLDLVITETVGKKQTVVARMALARISRAEIIDSKAFKVELATRKKERLLLFRYDNRLVAPRVCLVEFPDENSIVVFHDDQAMAQLLRDNIGGKEFAAYEG
ncbi:MAG: hypothetical protein E7589_03310 [Ruminococcaceae bacterium]|nr:hypothetical protein [Oscillospiraceae bacterium]